MTRPRARHATHPRIAATAARPGAPPPCSWKELGIVMSFLSGATR